MAAEDEPKYVFATLKMPDGKEYEVPLPAKVFSTGRRGFYGQIPPMAYGGDVYGGQIQIWKKSDKKDEETAAPEPRAGDGSPETGGKKDDGAADPDPAPPA